MRDKKLGSQSKPGARGASYEAYKQSLVDEVMRVFVAEFPQLAEKIDLVMGASPLTNNFYLGSTSGEVILPINLHVHSSLPPHLSVRLRSTVWSSRFRALPQGELS